MEMACGVLLNHEAQCSLRARTNGLACRLRGLFEVTLPLVLRERLHLGPCSFTGACSSCHVTSSSSARRIGKPYAFRQAVARCSVPVHTSPRSNHEKRG